MEEKHPNVKLIESFFTAYSKADFEGIQKVMDKNVEWHIPGNHPYSGIKKGIKELMEYFEKLNDFGFKAEQIVMGVNDNYVIDCHRNWSTSETHGSLNALSCLLWKIEGNKIVEVINFPQEQSLVDDFFQKNSEVI